MNINLIPKEAFDLLKEVYGDLAKPSVQTAGTAVDSMLKLVMLPFRCLGMTVDELENKYKIFITNTLKKIPPEKLQPSQPSIAGQIFEHIKYRFTESEIVELFSNLLANSMNLDSCEYVHPAFVEIIKHMSSLDAHNLYCFKKNCTLPIVEYRKKKTNNEYETLITDVFLANTQEDDLHKQSSSISNLLRLGVIFFSYSNYFLDDKVYEPFTQLPFFKSLQLNTKDGEVEIRKGKLMLSPLGADFLKICYDV
jgi:hypothetical protein